MSNQRWFWLQCIGQEWSKKSDSDFAHTHNLSEFVTIINQFQKTNLTNFTYLHNIRTLTRIDLFEKNFRWNGKFAFSVLRFHLKKPFLSSQQSYVLTKKVKKGQWNIPRARACMGLGFEKKERKTQNQADFGSTGLQWYAMWNLGRANIPHFLVARPLRKKAFETSVSVRHRTSSDVFYVRREKGQRPFAQGL